jgi:hypothetical protein
LEFFVNNLFSAAKQLERASLEELSSLLDSAKVGVGHLGGRYVSFQADNPSQTPTTFSQIRKRVDSLCNETFAPLRERQAEYKRQTAFRPLQFGGFIPGEILLLPVSLIGHALSTAGTIAPTLSREEEDAARQVLALRKQIDQKLQELVKKSDAEVANLSKIGQAYDRFLDTDAAIRNRHPGDEELVGWLASNRPSPSFFSPQTVDLIKSVGGTLFGGESQE